MVPPCACLTRSKRPGLPFQLPKLAYGLMPDLRDVAELMRAMTEEWATRLRDAALAFQVRGWLPPLDTRPDLAGLLLLVVARIPQLDELLRTAPAA